MIGAVLVVHSIYPEKLLASMAEYEGPVHIFLFFHGYDEALKARLIARCGDDPRITFLPYGINRGLSRSWNEGILLSRQSGHELTLMLNDDLHFVSGGLAALVAHARAVVTDYGIISVRGLEIGDSPLAGHILPQDLACCVIGPAAIEAIGYFDTNFHPAYFEDMDYKYRLKLAGLPIIIPDDVLAEHDRSSTSRASETIAKSFNTDFHRNQDYYRRKWGGDPFDETFTTPFNNPAASIHIGFEQSLTLHGG